MDRRLMDGRLVDGRLDEVAPTLVLALADRLRAGGVPVSTSEILDAITALRHVELDARSRVRAALHTTLVKDMTHEVLFRRSFEAVFPRLRRESTEPDGKAAHAGQAGQADQAGQSDDADRSRDDIVRALRDGEEERLAATLDDAIDRFGAAQDDGRSARHHARRMLRRLDLPDLYRRYLEQERAAGTADGTEDGTAGGAVDGAASAAEARVALDQLGRRIEDMLAGRLREGGDAQALTDVEDRPLLTAGADELAAMRLAMRPLARRLAARLGAQRRRGGGSLDMRRTIRASMGFGGVPVTPVMRRRRPTRPDLVVLCDVSGSTAQFAPFSLTLLHAVHEEFRRVRSFVFVDGIAEITSLLEAGPGVLDPHHLLSRPGLIADDGRSDYARALTVFLARWGEAVTAKTTVIIAGDARSHDREPATPVIAELGHRARRLYWLNPEPRREWDRLDSRAGEYAAHCTDAFEVATIRQLTSAVTQIV